MKKLLNVMKTLLPVAAIMLSMASCKEEDPAKEATIAIKVTATSQSSVSFELTATDAKSVSYAVAEAAQIESATYETIDEVGTSPIAVTKDGLAENAEYVIRAYATNADGKKSTTAEETFMTTSAPSIDIEVIEVTSSEVTFKLMPLNAASMKYSVEETSVDAETVELKNTVDNGEEQEITVDGLAEDSRYFIIAVAVNASGEESERAFETIRTELEPKVTIGEITAESNQARVALSYENVAEYAYAVAKKGDPEPEEGSYSKQAATGSSTSFIVSQLEPSTDYVLYVYGINMKGYAGETVSKEFSTTEYVEKPFELSVSNISSTDALISARFDSDEYSGYYIVLGTSKDVNSETYDFQTAIDNIYSGNIPPRKYTEDSEFRLREWKDGTDTQRGFSLEAMYVIGGCPVKTDGSLDTNAIIWTSAQMKTVTFGESSLTATINEKTVTLGEITYNVSLSDESAANGFFVHYSSGDLTSDETNLEKQARNALFYQDANFTLGKDTTQAYLSPGTTYTLIAVPRDKDGKLGQIATHVFTTKSLDYENPDITCEVELAGKTTSDMTFNVTLPSGVEEIRYKYDKTSSIFSEDDFVKAIKTNGYGVKTITASGELKLEGLSAETEYTIGFVPVSEDGDLGVMQTFKEKTDSYVFDGNPAANVEMTVTKCEESQWGGYTVFIDLKPNEYVKEYVAEIKSETNNVQLTHSGLVDMYKNGSTDIYTGNATMDGYNHGGESAGDNSYLWILAVDTDGKYVPVIEYKIDGTWK